METPTVWHNPRCSKSRGAVALLTERGIEPTLVRYLDDGPDRAALEDVLRKLGTDDPRAITRTGEARYRELGLASADRDALLDALVMRHVEGFAGVMEQVFTTRRFRSWERAVDVVVDAYVDYYRSQPSFRALWFGRGLSPAAMAADKANNSLLAEGATAFFAPLMPGARDLAAGFDVALEIADAVLDLAFRDEPDGDPEVIREAKVAVCAYLRTRLP